MRKKVIVVVICLGCVVAFFSGLAIFFFMMPRTTATQQQRALTAPETTDSPMPSATPNATNSSFANLPESQIPGRYRYVSGDKDYFIILYADHSFKNKDGTVLPAHRWDVSPEGLVLQWIRNKSLYDRIEAPGIYVGTKEDGTTRRLEKQNPTDPADLVKPAAF